MNRVYLLLQEGRVISVGKPKTVLTPDNLQRVYRVQAIHGEYRDQPYVVPWQSSTPEEPSVSTTPVSIPAQFSEISIR